MVPLVPAAGDRGHGKMKELPGIKTNGYMITITVHIPWLYFLYSPSTNMSGSNAAASLAQSFGDLQIEGSNNVVHQGISNNSKRKIQDCTYMLLWPSNETAGIETGHFIVPRSVNSLFTGRENALKRLSSQLGNTKQSAKSSEKQKRIVITGLGGVGKSEICLKLIDRVRKR